MKILVITQYFYPEPFRINELCFEFVKKKYDVKVLCPYPSYPYGKVYDGYGYGKEYEKNINGVNIERINSLPRGKTIFGLLLNCLSFVFVGKKWVLKCEQFYDIVYFFGVSPMTSAMVAKYYKQKFPKTKFIINVQDLWPENVESVLKIKFKFLSEFIIKIMKQIYDAADLILCSSKSFVEHLHNIRYVDINKLKYWPQFYIKPNELKYKIPSEFVNVNNNIIKIVYTGNVGYAQGLDILIDAAKFIRDKSIDVRWYIVGDGRAKNNLEKLIIKYKLGKYVIFVGRKSVDEANNYSHFADMSFLSFKNSIFNMTIPAKLQGYLACGSPILCVAGGESAKIVEDNNCGFVVENFSNKKNVLNEILLSINKYISMSKEQKEMLHKNSYDCYLKNFTIEKLMQNFEKYIKETSIKCEI